MDTNTYNEQGITKIIRSASGLYSNNPNVRRFMAKFIPAVQKSIGKKNKYKKEGISVPTFLTAGITAQLTDTGNEDGENVSDILFNDEMDVRQWQQIFEQSVELGITLVILMCRGGMPRKEVLEAAAQIMQIVFPTIIDSTFFNPEYIEFFNKNRNLMPVLNIDHGRTSFKKFKTAVESLKQKNIPFGACITVTSEYIEDVTEPEFTAELKNSGCTNITFLETAPEQIGYEDLLLSQSDRLTLKNRIQQLTNKFQDLIILFFTKDDNPAVNKEYIHINADGTIGTFYSSSYFDIDLNLKNCSLLEVFELISSID